MKPMKSTHCYPGGTGELSTIFNKSLQRQLTHITSQVFPNYIASARPVTANSALAKIKAKREAAKQEAAKRLAFATSTGNNVNT